LRPGLERRWPFVALEREPRAIGSLEAALPEGTRVFVQHERVEHHCAACAAGEPHDHGAAVPTPAAASAQPPVSLVRGKVIVAPTQDLSEFRQAWEAAIEALPITVSLPALYEQLTDSKRAGQEHQAWRGIEGKALRERAR
ncbi:MAG: hypothetical protein OEV36_04970, partial [Myxococcales bacterium]|nr:hypothetical protein [Myxococcales bacterium]